MSWKNNKHKKSQRSNNQFPNMFSSKKSEVPSVISSRSKKTNPFMKDYVDQQMNNNNTRSFPKFLSTERSASNEVEKNSFRGAVSMTRLRKSAVNLHNNSPGVLSENGADARRIHHKANQKVMQVYIKKPSAAAKSRYVNSIKKASKLYMADSHLEVQPIKNPKAQLPKGAIDLWSHLHQSSRESLLVKEASSKLLAESGQESQDGI